MVRSQRGYGVTPMSLPAVDLIERILALYVLERVWRSALQAVPTSCLR